MDSQKITPIHYLRLVKIFELDGFTIMRQKGDHLILTKPGVNRPVVIKTSPRKVPVTHIMTNLRTSGMSRERYFELLRQT
jgi:predicted RNA binding protein YcfA (HicA-like mRNA interferase family)